MLRERNEHVNLTSIVSPEGILTLHMLDSLTVAPHLGDAQRIIDVGTGGGFPGIPLAVACPQRDFTLIDGTQKKIRFVAESIARSTSAMRTRSRRAPRATRARRISMPWWCARSARSPTFYITPGISPAPRGRVLAMKGRLPEEELRTLPRGWHADVVTLRVPGLDAERHLVALSRQKK